MKTDLLFRAAGLSLEAAKRAGSFAVSATRYVAGEVQKRRSGDDGPADEADAAPPPPPEPGEPSRPPRAAAATPPPPAPVREAPPEPEPEPEPEHVDREAVVVGEFADAGAEDGPHAELHVDEPWEGYGELNARDVNAQLADATPAMLAVARLYETTHRNRVTVLAEIDRRLAD